MIQVQEWIQNNIELTAVIILLVVGVVGTWAINYTNTHNK